jgi:hypothetical protein
MGRGADSRDGSTPWVREGRELLAYLCGKMRDASVALDFERAAGHRDLALTASGDEDTEGILQPVNSSNN